jgi:hypothetical protein
MDSTPTGVDPKEVIVTKVVANRAIKDLDSGSDKHPASRTDVSLRAATADGIIVCHIDIEHELALDRFEGGWPHGFLVSWLNVARTAIYHRASRGGSR